MDDVEDVGRSGFIAVVGRPNVGKSTLVNALVGSKISIVSPKPQTTRHRICGIRTEEKGTNSRQFIFVDVPGLHGKPGRQSRALNRHMNRVADSALQDVDIVLWLLEAGQWRDDDELMLKRIGKSRLPVGLAINKIDRVKDKQALLPFIQEMQQRHDFRFIVPISALRAENLEPLLEELGGYLPEGPLMFPPEQVTDRGLGFQVAEIIREKLMLRLEQELPYALTVEIEQLEEDPESGRLEIAAVIWVARESHKGMVIGKQGAGLKDAGSAARREIQRITGRKVHLQLWVKVREGWADDERALHSLGYEEL